MTVGAKADGEPLSTSEARAASRGFLVITGAKVWFLVSATVLNLGLPRLLVDPGSFGAFGVVNSLLAIVNMVLIGSALQAAAKRTSEHPAAAGAVRRAGLRLQLGVGLAVAGALLVGASALAEVERDPSLAPLFQLAALVPLAYSLYAVLIGVLNGLKRFLAQALFDMGFATAKVTLMIGMVVAGLGVAGAFIGFGVAAVGVLGVALLVTARTIPRAPVDAPPVRLAGFMFQAMGYLFLTNCALNLDVLVLKAGAHPGYAVLLGLPEHAHPLAVEAALSGSSLAAATDRLAAEAASSASGLYRAAKNVGLIPYQAVAAIGFVLFPLVSRATSDRDAQAARAYLRQANRVAWLLVGAMAVVLAGGGEPLLVLLFGEAYRVAHPSLLPLLGGMVAFAMLSVVSNMLSAAGRPWAAILACGATLCVQMAGIGWALAAVAPGPELLRWVSLATLAASVVGALAAGGLLLRAHPGSIPWSSLARGGIAATGGLLAGSACPWEGITGVFVRASVAGVVFVVALFVMRELTGAELGRVVRMVREKRT
jgi:O-antigen/teichoic acid export membrane protein